ncbi:TP901 family phage tail tape measure protein [Sphingobium sp. JAI105]|uniref:phage tail tape measure protein n=1 Tax=Sphingobium sp. JAI105 TaxID=2787715 RepID=UPI0018C929E7|nr:phage tail tape measure protein [Sphingobium sp. JAI105]MBG6118784.1 TP901 family phage tail tape measure protein [Sphingobium sp. JAI105]
MNNKLSLLVNFVGVDKMSGAMKNIIGLGNKGSKSLRALAGDSRKLTSELKSVQREIAKGAGNITQLVDRERDLERQLVQTNRYLERQKHLAAIDADKAAMQRRGEDLKGKGRDNVVGGATMAAPIILAVKAAADFSSGMVDIQQKADLSDAATRRMADNIVNAAAAAKQMPEAMRAGVDVLSGFGIDPRLATRMIAPIGRLGTAFKVEIADGAAAAYANLNNLKVPVGQTARALDVMAAAGNAGAFEVKDMARHFPGLTAQMQALGQKGVPAVADLSAALQIARRGAGDADEAANNVQNLLSKINAPATVKAFEKNFGIDLPAALKAAYAKGKTPLEAIAELTKKATGGDMTKLGYAFEDMQAQSALRSMILNMEDFQKMRSQIAASSGTVDRAFNQRVAADATVQWRAFLGTASRLAIVLGTTLLPVGTEVMGMMSGAAESVAAWAQANPGLAAGIMKGAAALITLRVGLGVAQYALGAVLGPLGRVIAVARKAAPVLGLLRTASMFLARGILQAGAMMLANPMVLAITAIVLAIGGAAYLIYTHWDSIKAAFFGGVGAVKGLLNSFPAWMKNIGSMMMSGLLSAINPLALGARLIAMAKNGITALKNYLGIKSPSRVFMALGGHVAGGLERGIDGNRNGPARAAGRMAAGVLAAGSLAMAPAGAAGRGGGGAGRAGGDTYHITLQIQQLPGEDAEALARRVMEKIEQLKARKSRSSYEDDR